MSRSRIVPYIGPDGDPNGLDSGIYLPGHAPRKKAEPKTPEEAAKIRAKAWETRRDKLGPRGHR